MSTDTIKALEVAAEAVSAAGYIGAHEIIRTVITKEKAAVDMAEARAIYIATMHAGGPNRLAWSDLNPRAHEFYRAFMLETRKRASAADPFAVKTND